MRETLVKLSGDSHDKDGPSIGQHLATHLRVKSKVDAPQLLVQENEVEHRTEQIDVKYPYHVVVEGLAIDAEGIEMKHRQPEEIDQVEHDVQTYIGDLQGSEFDGFMLTAQVSERNGREGVERNRDIHHHHIFRVVSIAQQFGYLSTEQQHDHRSHQTHRANHSEHRGIHFFPIHALLVHESEESGLHAEGQHHDENSHIGIDVRDDAIFASCRSEFQCLYRHEQVIDKTCHNAAQAIDGGILCQRFKISHIIS